MGIFVSGPEGKIIVLDAAFDDHVTNQARQYLYTSDRSESSAQRSKASKSTYCPVCIPRHPEGEYSDAYVYDDYIVEYRSIDADEMAEDRAEEKPDDVETKFLGLRAVLLFERCKFGRVLGEDYHFRKILVMEFSSCIEVPAKSFEGL